MYSNEEASGGKRLEIVETPQRLQEICSRFSFAVGVDTETTGLNPHSDRLRLVQLSDSAEQAYIIDLFDKVWRREGALLPLVELFSNDSIVKVAHNAKFEIKWLTRHMLQAHGERCRTWFCTQLASQLCAGGDKTVQHSLKALSLELLNVELDKEQRLTDWSAPMLNVEQIEYAANDVYVLLPLYDILCQRLHEDDLWRVAGLEMDAVIPIAEMELAGVYINREAWERLLEEKIAYRDAVLAEVHELLQPGVNWQERNAAKVGKRPVKPKYLGMKKPIKKDCAGEEHYLEMMERYIESRNHFENVVLAEWQGRYNAWAALPDNVRATINLNSPVQVRTALLNLGVPLGERKTNEKELTEVANLLENRLRGLLAQQAAAVKATEAPSQKFLQRLEGNIAELQHALRIIERLLEYRGAEKSVTSYGENILTMLTAEGRIHPDFRQLGTETGRLSCREPNVQQIPRDAAHRGCVQAPPGRKLLIADYAQIELRVMAELSTDANFVHDFNGGLDMHSTGASRFFRVPYEEVSKELRQKAKSVNFLVIYGGGAFTLANRLKCSEQEAEELLRAYFQAYPGNKEFMDKAAKQATQRGYARTMYGRLIAFDVQKAKREDNWRLLNAFGRNGINAPIQGTSADMLKRALHLLGERLHGTSTRIVNIVHDEIVLECDDSDEALAHAKTALKWAMETAGEEILTLVGCPVDVTIADTWADKK